MAGFYETGGQFGPGPSLTIEDEGVALPIQPTMNLVGAGVTAVDVGGKTVVTIPGGFTGVDIGAVAPDPAVVGPNWIRLNSAGAAGGNLAWILIGGVLYAAAPISEVPV